MSIAVLPNGVSYNIPLSDMTFFKELAARMKWEIIDKAQQVSAKSVWSDDVAGMKQAKVANVKNLELEQAMALMDTMMVKSGTPIPADEDCNGALAREKYGV